MEVWEVKWLAQIYTYTGSDWWIQAYQKNQDYESYAHKYFAPTAFYT